MDKKDTASEAESAASKKKEDSGVAGKDSGDTAKTESAGETPNTPKEGSGGNASAKEKSGHKLPRRSGRKNSTATSQEATAQSEKKSPPPAQKKRKRQSSSAEKRTAPHKNKAAKKAAAVNNIDDNDDGSPKMDGRKKNKGSSKREAYSCSYKAKRIQEYEAWEAQRRSEGHEHNLLKDFLAEHHLPAKYEKFLSATCGWRQPKVRARILQDAAHTEYKDMARMPDRSRNKSYYAEMEANLLQRMDECREKNLTLSTSDIRKYAKEEVRKLAKTEEEAKKFKASNGWIFNFLNRQKRKQKEEEARQKLLKKQEKQVEQQQQQQQQHKDNNNTYRAGNDNDNLNDEDQGREAGNNHDTNVQRQDESLTEGPVMMI